MKTWISRDPWQKSSLGRGNNIFVLRNRIFLLLMFNECPNIQTMLRRRYQSDNLYKFFLESFINRKINSSPSSPCQKFKNKLGHNFVMLSKLLGKVMRNSQFRSCQIYNHVFSAIDFGKGVSLLKRHISFKVLF